MSSVSAILLAAGESTRMGQPKALLDWHGRPLVAYQARELAAVDAVADIIVVTGHGPDAVRDAVRDIPKVRTAHNARYRTGKVSSILTGLDAVSPDATGVLLLAVDQPRPAAVHARLIAERERTRAPIALPTHAGRRGHPVLFAASLLPELRRIDEATLGIRAVLGRHAAEVLAVPFDDPDVLADLNTPEDIARAGDAGA